MSERMARLSLSFPQTFAPEREYIGALLEYAASERSGTEIEISRATGIPTGSQSGKVPATLGYCRGMQLLGSASLSGETKSPQLTPLADIVLQEDKYLSEVATQWLCHLNLCRRDSGGELWYQVFAASRCVLGMVFNDDHIQKFVQDACGKRQRSPLGPLRSMYSNDRSFPIEAIGWDSAGRIVRSAAPLEEQYVRAYAVWLLGMCESFFPEVGQIALDELSSETRWQDAAGWTDDEAACVLRWMQDRSIIDVDRQMSPWVIHPQAISNDVCATIYDELV